MHVLGAAYTVARCAALSYLVVVTVTQMTLYQRARMPSTAPPYFLTYRESTGNLPEPPALCSTTTAPGWRRDGAGQPRARRQPSRSILHDATGGAVAGARSSGQPVRRAGRVEQQLRAARITPLNHGPGGAGRSPSVAPGTMGSRGKRHRAKVRVVLEVDSYHAVVVPAIHAPEDRTAPHRGGQRRRHRGADYRPLRAGRPVSRVIPAIRAGPRRSSCTARRWAPRVGHLARDLQTGPFRQSRKKVQLTRSAILSKILIRRNV